MELPLPDLWIALGAWFGALLWLLGALSLGWRLWRLPIFEQQGSTAPSPLPRLSVILPVHDQREALARGAAGFLAQTGVELELILVDDRSTDGTAGEIDALADRDPRVIAVHVTEVPPGWLGKVYAMEQGLGRATGALVLFSDVDLNLAPGALARAVALVEGERLDHLTVLPRVEPVSFALTLLSNTVKLGLVATWPPPGPGRPGAYLGIGPFNLVRREALASTEGLPWLRLEVLDDLGLGLLMSRPGFRRLYAASKGELTLRWYASAGAMIRGLEKNAYALVGHYRLWRASLATVGIGVLVVAPWTALLTPATAWPALAVTGASCLVLAAVASRRLGGTGVSFLPLPLGALLFAAALVRSTVLFLHRGGISWGGIFVSAAELRRHQRVKA